MEKSTAKARLSREDWIVGALELLAEKGAAAVAVEPLATRLGVTKGSFYWHFRDLAELQESMRLAWSRVSTEDFIERVTRAGGDAKTRFLKLLDLTSKSPNRLERAMRAWAVANPDTAAYVAGVDARRAAFLADLFAEYGHDPSTAAAYARLLACFVVGEMLSGLKPDGGANAIIAATVLRVEK